MDATRPVTPSATAARCPICGRDPDDAMHQLVKALIANRRLDSALPHLART